MNGWGASWTSPTTKSYWGNQTAKPYWDARLLQPLNVLPPWSSIAGGWIWCLSRHAKVLKAWRSQPSWFCSSVALGSEWNNLLHFHPPSSLYLHWVMRRKRAALDVGYFPGVSKALVFRPLYLCAPNLSGLFFFFFPSCSWIHFYSVYTTQSKHPPSKVQYFSLQQAGHFTAWCPQLIEWRKPDTE